MDNMMGIIFIMRTRGEWEFPCSPQPLLWIVMWTSFDLSSNCPRLARAFWGEQMGAAQGVACGEWGHPRVGPVQRSPQPR